MDEGEVRKETILAIAKSSHYNTGKDYKFPTFHSFEDFEYNSWLTFLDLVQDSCTRERDNLFTRVVL